MGIFSLSVYCFGFVLFASLPTNNGQKNTLRPLFVGVDSTYYISNFKGDIATAHNECRNLGNYQLLSLETEAEDKSVLHELKSRGIFLPFWTSGVEKRENSNVVYIWESTSEPISYSNFADVLKRGVKRSSRKRLLADSKSVVTLCECGDGGTTTTPGPNDCDPDCEAPKCTVSPADCTTENPTCTVDPVSCTEVENRVCKSTCPPCKLEEPPSCTVGQRPPCKITPGKCTVEDSVCTIQSPECTSTRPPCETFYKNCTRPKPICTTTGPCITTPNPCKNTTLPCKETCTTSTPPCYEQVHPCRIKRNCNGGNCSVTTECPESTTVCPPETTTCSNQCPGQTTCRPVFDCKPKALVCMSPPLVCSYNETFCPPPITSCTHPIITCTKPSINCSDPISVCPDPEVICEPAKVVCPATVISCSDAVAHCEHPKYNCSNPEVKCPPPVVVCEEVKDCVPCTIPPPHPTTPKPCKCKKRSVDNETDISAGGCISLGPQNDFKWEVQNCTEENYFICESRK